MQENACVSTKNDEYRAIDACLRKHQFPFSTSAVVSQCCIVCADVYVRVMSISQLRPPHHRQAPPILAFCPAAPALSLSALRTGISAPLRLSLVCSAEVMKGDATSAIFCNFHCAPLCSGRLNHSSHSILSRAFPSCALLQQVPSEMSGQRREMLRNIVGGGVSYVMKPLGHKPA